MRERIESNNKPHFPNSIETIEEALDRLYATIHELYPILSNTKIQKFESEHDADGGGFFDFEINEHGEVATVVNISNFNSLEIQNLFIHRKHAIRHNAALLQIPLEKMTPQLLYLFIIAHELGHVYDFESNYRGYHTTGAEAVIVMDDERENCMQLLPIPGKTPNELIHDLRDVSDIALVFKNNPGLRSHHRALEIQTIDDLIRVQEEEYRDIPPEKFADDFARTIVKKLLGQNSVSPLYAEAA